MSSATYTPFEETLHSIIHATGFVAGLLAIPWLLSEAAAGADPWRVLGAVVFSVSAMLVFATSTLYHRAVNPASRLRWRRLDHAAIYVLIAGTYTPFTIGVMRGSWGWSLFGVVWGVAALGIYAKATPIGFRFPRLSTALYLVMGWAGIVAIKPMMQALSSATLAWIAAGGLLYTLGVPFYVWKSRRYTHAIWHLMVLGGVICHFMAVRSVVAPAS
jgi:hemolysin III